METCFALLCSQGGPAEQITWLNQLCNQFFGLELLRRCCKCGRKYSHVLNAHEMKSLIVIKHVDIVSRSDLMYYFLKVLPRPIACLLRTILKHSRRSMRRTHTNALDILKYRGMAQILAEQIANKNVYAMLRSRSTAYMLTLSPVARKNRGTHIHVAAART